MKRSERGAIRVSIVWMVVTLVAFFVAAYVAFVGYDEAARHKAAAQASESKAKEAEVKTSTEVKAQSDLSGVVGWTDTGAAQAKTSVDALKADLEQFKQTFGLGDDVKSLRDALAQSIGQYNGKLRDIDSLSKDKSDAESRAKVTEVSLQDSINTKEKELESLRKQLTDATDSASAKEQEYEQRISDLRNQVSQLDSDLRNAKAETENVVRKHGEEVKTWETRVAIQGSKLRFLDEPEAVDGRVLAVSKDLGTGFIDIGAHQRLARGTRFRVVTGRPGASRIKGWCEVLTTEAQRSEVRFFDVVDPYDPIVSGDVIYNPLYDPKGERIAVLLGRFSGKFNEKQVRDLLANMGIQVRDQLDLNTDYLIVGGEMYTDRDGNPVESPIAPSELAEYKQAESLGVQITPIKDLKSYFAL